LAIVLVFVTGLLSACEEDSNDSNGASGETPANGEETCVPSNKQYSAAPEVTIDPAKTYVATIKTAKGDIVVELDSARTVTTNNFVFLAQEGFYDCLTFHRVEPNFVIQGGDPQGNGMGGPGYQIAGDFEGSQFVEGTLGMARGPDPDSAGSQFYIVIGPAPHLNGQYTAFGMTTSGIDVAKQIAVGDQIESITIEER
jgi:cyclophilin family peptidyl-prolyl cis-trans isomerase